MISEPVRLSGKREREEEAPVLTSLSVNHDRPNGRKVHRVDSNHRISRHIPDRDGMDMVVSAYNLKSANSASQLSGSSFCDSLSQSDDHSNSENLVRSQYRDRLAGRLQSQQQKRLGGEVLSFRGEATITKHPVAEIHSNNSSCALRPVQSTAQRSRPLHSIPERVLDGPGIPLLDNGQIIDWGSNNKMLIGLRSALYAWDATAASAVLLFSLASGTMIRNVRWLSRTNLAMFTLRDGGTTLFDTNSQQLLRCVKTPEQTPVTQLAVRDNGETSIFAAAANSGLGRIFIFDIRLRDPQVAMYENQNGRVGTISYSPCDPYFLAAGSADGTVAIWDARNAGSPRYTLPQIHNGAVSSLAWNPEKSSTIFSGGSDGVLRLVDIVGNAAVGKSPVVLTANTRHPITGIVAPNGAGEVVTSHRGVLELQLRNTSNFSSIGVFTASSMLGMGGINCLTLAPDRECVCGAAEDETLKFWRVFRPPANDLFDFGGEALR